MFESRRSMAKPPGPFASEEPWRCCKLFARITSWNDSRNGIQRVGGCQKQNAFASVFSKGKRLLHFWQDMTRTWSACKQTGGEKGRNRGTVLLGLHPLLTTRLSQAKERKQSLYKI